MAKKKNIFDLQLETVSVLLGSVVIVVEQLIVHRAAFKKKDKAE